ncbi:hypothetical protein ACOKM5_27145 [Streptomyces sp. BH097]|uniref:hypothetical protein n=1 Tax=unclassified Streptomyces TaxID=2593676 RepID=UPI003BB5C88D
MADENEPHTLAERPSADAELEAETDVGAKESGVEAEPGPKFRIGIIDGSAFAVGSHNTVHVPYTEGHITNCPHTSIESADAALKRGAEPEIVNEILAGGAVAASFTAAASIAKAKLEATTQRQKNTLDAETERLRIESNERIAGFQGMTAQVETEGPEPGDA